MFCLAVDLKPMAFQLNAQAPTEWGSARAEAMHDRLSGRRPGKKKRALRLAIYCLLNQAKNLALLVALGNLALPVV